MEMFRKLASIDGLLRRMLSVRKDRHLSLLVNITGRWREFTQRYRNVASLAGYADELRRILSLNTSSGEAMSCMESFLVPP